MKKAAKETLDLLKGDTTVNDLVQGRVFWERGLDRESLPMIAFSIQETPGQSKDRPGYSAIVRCFADEMTGASTVYEAAKAALVTGGHTFRGGQSGITDDEDREAVAEVIVELNNL